MQYMIEVAGLYKAFGNIKAVNGISFRVEAGSLFAFLGVNGAGKSTTIHILCDTLKKDNGRVIVNGKDMEQQADQIKRDIGVVFQNSVLDALLSVKDNLKTRAALYGMYGVQFQKRLAEISRLFELDALLNRPVGKLSGGQRRRVDIARALIHKPCLLILDEPTTGLDPQTRVRTWEILHGLRKNEGLTVFLTTHYMEEAADADHVVILDNGEIAAEGTPHELKSRYAGDWIRLYGGADSEALETRLRQLALPFTRERDVFVLAVAGTAQAKALLLQHPDLFADFEVLKGNMDDVFLKVTGKHLREEA